jgi:hypothetical protein
VNSVRSFATADKLRAVTRAALGPDRCPVVVTRLRGGSQKGVYRLFLDDDSTAIVYVWGAAENYWPETAGNARSDLADPFASASALELFESAQRHLAALEVRVPRVYLIDSSREHYPADVALLEDIPGDSLEVLLARDPQAMGATMERLADSLAIMHRRPGPRFGKVALLDAGGVADGESCEQLVRDRALLDLSEAAARDVRIGAVEDQMKDVVLQLAAAVTPRSQYGLIHGELGPDHVLVDQAGEPVLIDIEGLMYFDIEWEHVFLARRFGEHYARLKRPDLDPARLRFYLLAMRLSLVAGPLRLLDGDFPDRDGMLDIVEGNLREALTFLP